MVIPYVLGSLPRADIARGVYLFKMQNHTSAWLMIQSFSVGSVLHGFAIVPESHLFLLFESLACIC